MTFKNKRVHLVSDFTICQSNSIIIFCQQQDVEKIKITIFLIIKSSIMFLQSNNYFVYETPLG